MSGQPSDPGVPPATPARETEHPDSPCWLTIGVWGREEPRCPELERVTHCHNCPVFHEGGRHLFDREPETGYGAGWVESLQRLRRDTRERPILVFRLAGELFALTLDALVAVSEWRPIRTIPHRRDETLLGLVNLGGELRVCVSLEVLFDLARPDPAVRPPKGRLLLIGRGAPEWAVPVEETVTMREVVLDDLVSAPATVQYSSSPYVRGMLEWRGRDVAVLDEELLLGALGRRVG